MLEPPNPLSYMLLGYENLGIKHDKTCHIPCCKAHLHNLGWLSLVV